MRSHKNPRKRFPKISSFLFTLSIFAVASLFLALLYLRSQALPVVKIMQTTQILDIHGELIDSFHSGQNRQIVPLSEISPHLIQATLSIEDHRFYDHFGIDPKGLARAIAVDLQHMAKVEGASTITQQLARNLYLNHDRTWTRKLKEAIYAVQLELQLSKDQILEGYLNQIYYGFSTYGIEAAAQMHFGKTAKELSLAESTLLAGVPKGPRYYSPYWNMENAKKRQQIILNAMVNQQFITEYEATEASREPLEFLPARKESGRAASHFRDYIRHLAIHRFGISEEQFDGGGIKIYTTLDLNAQRNAEESIERYLANFENIQAALISIDPRTGHIKALVGGRDYENNQYNRALANMRQPGSAFKPIVYLAALQHGYTPVTMFNSEPTAFSYDDGRKVYTPANFGERYYGMIDLREAIAKSDNIYAVDALMKIGADHVIATARSLGISSQMQPLPSLALGTFPVSPYEMASAFGVLANQGIWVEPTAILRIVDTRGKVLYESVPKKEKVIEPAYAYVLTSLMESVFEEGGTGGRVASILKRPVAGKTGTTDTDAWMVGYTPELSTAVWIGYDRDRGISAIESYQAAPIFAEYTERTLEFVPPKLFQVPEGIVKIYIDPATGMLANSDCPNARLETFIRGTEPLQYCTEHGGTQSDTGDRLPSNKTNQSWWQDLKRWWNS